jgi:hypothetical protein
VELARSASPCPPSSHLSPLLIGLDCPEKGGKAVFARQRIAKGTLLVVWGGTILTGEGLRARPLAERRLALQVDDDAYLVSDVEGPADWVNHSCAPNAGLRGQISLVAMRDIRPGEEICFDYAMSDTSNYDEFDCRCGARSCRGRVTGDDWRRLDLAARYAGYFAAHIERRRKALQIRPRLRAVRQRSAE